MKIELTAKVNLTKSEYNNLVVNIKKELKSHAELLISDLAMPHQKLLEGYFLDVYIDEI